MSKPKKTFKKQSLVLAMQSLNEYLATNHNVKAIGPVFLPKKNICIAVYVKDLCVKTPAIPLAWDNFPIQVLPLR